MTSNESIKLFLKSMELRLERLCSSFLDAPVPHGRVYDDITESHFGSPQDVEESFVREKLGESIPQDYLDKFRFMVAKINSWALACVGPSRKDTPETFLVECPIMTVVVKNYDTRLILNYVCVRPCAEGHGFYKVFLYKLATIAKRDFDMFVVKKCLPQNQAILSRLGFSHDPDEEEADHVDMWLDKDQLNHLNRASWRLDWALDESEKLIKPAFPTADELNSSAYVQTFYDSKDAKRAREAMASTAP